MDPETVLANLTDVITELTTLRDELAADVTVDTADYVLERAADVIAFAHLA